MSDRSAQIYQQLVKPPLSPPGWIFGPVWTVLYGTMAVALFTVISSGHQWQDIQQAVYLFVLQLLLNLLWPYLYFSRGLRGVALADLVILWFLILMTILHFFELNSIAGRLMIPYFVWVTFAMYLNLATWWLNR